MSEFDEMRGRLARAQGALNVFGRVLPAQARDAIGTLVQVVGDLADRVELIEARERMERTK